MNLAGILVCIVIVFLCCHFPRLIINCAEFFMTKSIISCPNFIPPAWFLCLTRCVTVSEEYSPLNIRNIFSLMHWLLIVNASSNFLIYCFMGTKFKTILKENIKRWLKNNPQMFTDIFPLF